VIDITIVGDAMVDVDVVGTADRVGPEGCLVVDVDSDVRRPGGAALAAMFAARDGAHVRLVTAIGDDGTGRWLVRQLDAAGVDVVDLRLHQPTPQKWRIRAADGTVVRVDRNCREPSVPVSVARPGDLTGAAVLVSDYGRGVVPASATAIAAATADAPVVWDPHPRGASPAGGLDLLVPNESEARGLARSALPSTDPPTLACVLAAELGCTTAVTCGPRGAVVAEPGASPITVPARAAVGDSCGAGDRLSARVTLARGHGASAVTAVVEGVEAASRFVATGEWTDRHPHAGVRPGHPDAFQLAARTRAAGGRIVAAGGCFDLLHAGHVELLESARALGDCLIVCLNSDRSIRRIKGPGRPIVEEADRRRILESLRCVDAVAVFDDPTPAALLRELQPHVFAKGADYVAEHLPERTVMAAWGGTVAILPLAGTRSTSSLIDIVRERVS
jgi:D-beta-D-heptose 7-phosphate kinase / D-beta-D-heptose 1-phosphate adenosyltransferase